MWNRRALVGTVLCAASLGLAGCGGPAPSPAGRPRGGAVVTFWHTHNAEETETMEALLREFAVAHPTITVRAQGVPFSDAQNKFKTVAQAGDAPDVFRSEIAWTPEFASLGYLTALDTWVSRQDREDYLPAAFASCRYAGRIWGVPQVTDCLALLYNKRRLREAGFPRPPATVEGFVKTARRLTDPARGRYGFFFRADPYFFLPWVWAFGGGMVDERGTILIARPGSVKALEFLLALRDVHKVVPPALDYANDYDNQQAGFKAGAYAMILNGPWAVTDILSGKEFQDRGNLGVAPLPRGPAGTGSPVGGHHYVISASCRNPAAAYALVTFLNRPDHQARLALKNSLLPTRRSAYREPGVRDHALIQAFRRVLVTANTRPVIPAGAQLFTPFTPSFQAALSGKIPPRQALEEVAAAWARLLDR